MPSALGTLHDPPGEKDMSYLVYSATANLDPDKWWKIDVIEWWAWAAIDAKACPPKKRAPPQEAWNESRENTISRWVVISSSQLRWSFLIKVMKVTNGGCCYKSQTTAAMYTVVDYKTASREQVLSWESRWIVGRFKAQAKGLVWNRDSLSGAPCLWGCVWSLDPIVTSEPSQHQIHTLTSLPNHLHNTLSYFKTMYISTGLTAY